MSDTIPSPSFTSMLVSIARSPRAAAVASEARRLAALFGASLRFVHAGEESEEVRAELTAAVLHGGVAADELTLDLVDDGVSRTVCRLAEEHGVDLIIAGALEKEGALEYYVGSIARKIARKAPCSVLLLTAPTHPPVPPRTVVVSVELDDSSREALDTAVAICAHDGAELHVVYEYERIGLRQGVEGGLDVRGEEQLLDALHAEEEYRLVTWLEPMDLYGVSVRRVCVPGRKGWEAIAHAHRVRADLLVLPMPERRLGLWDKLFQHDVEFALESLPCATLLHRPVSRASD